MGAQSTIDSAGEPKPLLRFATGKIGCLLPMLALSALGFGWWAIRPDMLSEDGRHSALISAIKPMMVGGINVPLLLVSLYMSWELLRFGLRWADMIAVIAVDDGLCFHWTLLRRKRVPWREVHGARYHVVTQNWARVPEILIQVNDRAVSVRGFDDADGAGQAFVAAVLARAKVE